MASDEQSAWVHRVLGVEIPATSPARPENAIPPGELLVMFRDAKDEVDARLGKLQVALRDTEDEDLVRIADYGLYGMTNGEGVGLMKALMELRAAAPDKRAAAASAARDAAGAYRKAVFGHALADLVDDNPFGVAVGIKSTLGPALDAIAQAA